MNKGLVFDFHRGTTHDGPGMRTTVFFKGCPLHCRWCHNPESICPEKELWWDEKKCIGCMTCVNGCPAQALKAEPGGIRIDRELCRKCYRCADNCPAKAMSVAGTEWDVEALVKEACKDRMFFESFDGGVTVSGGEPALQPDFLEEFLKALKAEEIHTALDTSGFAKREVYERVYPYVDTFLYDIKFRDETLHRQYTGVSNRRILDNLRFLADKIRRKKDRAIWIRTPLIPGATASEENIRQIGEWIQKEILDVIDRWELCAFNNVCRDKYRKLGKAWEYAETPLMTEEEVRKLADAARPYAGELLVVSGLTAKVQGEEGSGN